MKALIDLEDSPTTKENAKITAIKSRAPEPSDFAPHPTSATASTCFTGRTAAPAASINSVRPTVAAMTPIPFSLGVRGTPPSQEAEVEAEILSVII